MSRVVLFGGSGFFGPLILKKNKEIISIGRTPPPKEITNKHIHLNNLDDLSSLDNIDFDKVIFLIGSSNHHEINNKITMGIDLHDFNSIRVGIEI